MQLAGEEREGCRCAVRPVQVQACLQEKQEEEQEEKQEEEESGRLQHIVPARVAPA